MDEEDYSKEQKKIKQKRKEGIDYLNLMFPVFFILKLSKSIP